MSEPSPQELAAEVFERLPYGLLVVDERGCVAHANELATQFLPRLSDGDGSAPRCDELFDCRAPGGPCEEECLALRAALSDRRCRRSASTRPATRRSPRCGSPRRRWRTGPAPSCTCGRATAATAAGARTRTG